MTDENTGDQNTGNWNTGSWNTGSRNAGHWNVGDQNTGNWNTGSWNTGSRNAGHWNVGDRNTGNWNTGSWNTGSRNAGGQNTGDWNVGDRNTGDWNVGDRNTGDWNVGDRNTGCFNTTTPEFSTYFNAPAEVSDWNFAKKPDFIYLPSATTWVEAANMTDAEKLENPTFGTCDGYLRKNDMMDEWAKAYAAATQEDIDMLRKLPNFDAEVFKEITGLDVDAPQAETCNGKIVTIEGVKYRLEEIK